MISFCIEIDTSTLTAAQEDNLMAEIEDAISHRYWWYDELYEGEIHIDAVQIAEITDDDSPYGQVTVYGETTREKLEEIYFDIIESYHVSYKDNDPLSIEFDKKILGLMKAGIMYDELVS